MSPAGPQLDRVRVLLSRGDLDAAIRALEAEASEWPEDPDIAYLRGRVHKARHELDAAERCYRTAIAFRPTDPDFWTSLGVLLRSRGKVDEAIEAYRRAVALAPDHLEANSNLASALGAAAAAPELAARARDRATAALTARIVEMRKAAAALTARGRPRNALAVLDAAIQLAPASSELRLEAGMLAADLGDLERSFEYAEAAVKLAPASVTAAEFARQRSFVGGLPGPAMRYGQLVHELEPSRGSNVARQLFLPAVQSSVESIQSYRAAYERGLDEALRGEPGTPPDPVSSVSAAFYLAYHGANDRILQTKMAQMYLKTAPGLAWSAPHCRERRTRRLDPRIRVGFISKFFCEHSIGKTSRGLIEQLDRDRFEVHAIRITPSAEDETTLRICRSADRCTVLDRDLRHAREQIAALGLDILFYQDIGMEPTSYFLAFARLAPVQCVSFGHPNTTGIPNIDYFVSNDLYEVPDAQDHYSEQLFLLRDLPTLAYYHRPPRPRGPISRSRSGLPADGNIYLCPQTLFKIHPDFDALIGGILRQDPSARVVFIDGILPQWTDALRERFARTLAEVSDRIIFLPRMKTTAFLELLAAADVILDTVHFNGMNSSLEALAVGTPVVTLPTRLQRGRHTQAMLRKLALEDCIAASPERYVDIAVRIGTDRRHADMLRSAILERHHRLYEDRRVVREFERFFVESLERAAGGLDPL